MWWNISVHRDNANIKHMICWFHTNPVSLMYRKSQRQHTWHHSENASQIPQLVPEYDQELPSPIALLYLGCFRTSVSENICYCIYETIWNPSGLYWNDMPPNRLKWQDYRDIQIYPRTVVQCNWGNVLTLGVTNLLVVPQNRHYLSHTPRHSRLLSMRIYSILSHQPVYHRKWLCLRCFIPNTRCLLLIAPDVFGLCAPETFQQDAGRKFGNDVKYTLCMGFPFITAQYVTIVIQPHPYFSKVMIITITINVHERIRINNMDIAITHIKPQYCENLLFERYIPYKSDGKRRNTLSCLDQYTCNMLRLWNSRNRETV